ncbi:MAG TPA: YCF48-related protein [Stenotrophobium sp.]|jgi:photosystem II stability/assembly factor-like uncharacterized protein|nr:YCF48-related protein [Stenotrophobium sp.]
MSARSFQTRNAGARWRRLLASAVMGMVAAAASTANAADTQTANAASGPVVANAANAPIPAMMAEHASSGLLLGVVNTGSHLVAVGGNGVIVLSEDGVHWTQVQMPVDVTLTGVSFADDQHGWAVGHDAVILYTADGGRSWHIQSYQPALDSPLFAVLAIDAQKVLAVGAFGLMEITDDGGLHWNKVDAPDMVNDKLHLNGITRLADGQLLVVGENSLAGVSADGLHWQRLTLPYDGSLFGALPWGDHGAIAYGLRGNIFMTADVHGGQWQPIEVATTNSFFGGFKLPSGEAVIVGGDSRVVRIDTSGKSHVMPSNPDKVGQSGSLAAGIFYKDKLLMVGESGVAHAALQ